MGKSFSIYLLNINKKESRFELRQRLSVSRDSFLVDEC